MRVTEAWRGRERKRAERDQRSKARRKKEEGNKKQDMAQAKHSCTCIRFASF
jgi:hypothetical protein